MCSAKLVICITKRQKEKDKEHESKGTNEKSTEKQLFFVQNVKEFLISPVLIAVLSLYCEAL